MGRRHIGKSGDICNPFKFYGKYGGGTPCFPATNNDPHNTFDLHGRLFLCIPFTYLQEVENGEGDSNQKNESAGSTVCLIGWRF
jgi:hypothetical protein